VARVSKELPLIYLARHGETIWAVSGRRTGRRDFPRTARGERNATRLAGRLLRSEEIHATRPDWQLFRDGCLGGESPNDIDTRADSAVSSCGTAT
jgi:broad specificity phosphatase PhoE